MTPYREDTDCGLFQQGFAHWLNAVGYTEARNYLETAKLQRAEVVCANTRDGLEIVASRGNGYTEFRQDVAASLARPDSAWAQ